ncbi:HNH endonuclease [Cryomorpha ignava]|uniref:HNH endonuclease n=1 Tax=Cryomorpha ignava TaxID=101383 RepID=A0A7K3WR99_9FLAO|nr:HNH endonuclease [Cryomorpha ignava]NEN24200.1 HNH endonuclease [Cryomorpha ignava]
MKEIEKQIATPNTFFNNYRKVSDSIEAAKSDKPKNQRTCRFCGSKNETNYRTKAHIIPELLGAHNHLSDSECDLCNRIFAEHENHLANFYGPFNSLLGIRTKKKVPVFKSRNEQYCTSISVKNENGTPRIFFGDNLNDFKFDNDRKRLTINFKKKSFIPVAVYKSFLKMAISICPDDSLIHFESLIKWLMDVKSKHPANQFPFLLYRTRLTKMKFDKPFATLYFPSITSNTNPNFSRLATIVVHAGISVFQTFFLIDENLEIDTKDEIPFYKYPAYVHDIKTPDNCEKFEVPINSLSKLKQIILNGDKKVDYDDELIHLSFKKVRRSKDIE